MSGGDSSLASSLTDLMTSLAVIFILLLVASLNNIHQEQETAVNSLQVILDKVLADFRRVGVEVRRDPKDPLVLFVIVPENLFNFAFDKADIPLEGVQFLQQFAPKLVRQICKDQLREKVASVLVEGHADPIGPYKAKLDVSQRRASSVVVKSVEILQSHQAAGASVDLSGCFGGLVSASGRGDAEPVLNSEGKKDHDASRRVIFKIRIRSFEQKFADILGGSSPTAIRVDR